MNNPFKEAVNSAAISTVSINGVEPEYSQLLMANPLTEGEKEVIALAAMRKSASSYRFPLVL
jgi:predicted nucleic acid-binding protein